MYTLILTFIFVSGVSNYNSITSTSVSGFDSINTCQTVLSDVKSEYEGKSNMAIHVSGMCVKVPPMSTKTLGDITSNKKSDSLSSNISIPDSSVTTQPTELEDDLSEPKPPSVPNNVIPESTTKKKLKKKPVKKGKMKITATSTR